LDRRKHLSLLIVRGDGTRLVRLSFPRRLPLIILGGLTALVIVCVVLVGDWWFTRVRTQEVGGLLRRVDGQHATITSLKDRLAGLQNEIGSWRALHARIWEPFGPDAAPRGRSSGIGGARVGDTTIERSSRPADAASLGPSEELDRLAEVVRHEGESLRALERLMSRAGKALASLPSRWPVRGAVNSEFGGRRSPWTKDTEFHGGMDIAAERGTPVQAPAGGTVAFVGNHAEYGLTVILDHSDDLRTIYGHLSKTSVRLGQRIARGAELGLTGNTGRSSGPHLHYEILVKNRPVNPRAFLWD
jgi:murein DD-endopeptidase MepM/ murein hydrolase activator NlpD